MVSSISVYYKLLAYTLLNGLKSEFNISDFFCILFVGDRLRVLNELELICLHASIAIVSTQLNGFNYCFAQSARAVKYTDCISAEG